MAMMSEMMSDLGPRCWDGLKTFSMEAYQKADVLSIHIFMDQDSGSGREWV